MSEPLSSPSRILAVLCAAEVLSMATYATYPAQLTVLQREWGLSNAASGLIGGAYFGGYMAAVPALVTLTDRIDARRIYAAGCLLAFCGALGFALLAGGLAGAMAFQALAGAGLAGTYMPGLKVLTDHLQGPAQSRRVAFYTATFGLGTALSLVLAEASGRLGWRPAFGIAAAGPALAAALMLLGTPPRRGHPIARHPALDFRPVLANRPAMGYVLGYAAHCWELFGLRSWMVAFLAFGGAFHTSSPAHGPAAAAALINLLGIPASILGNEAAVRLGRRRWVLAVMSASALSSALVGLAAHLPWPLLVLTLGAYFVVIMSDSAALTAGVVATSPHERRGATMAVHSFLGFGAGFAAPLVFGAVLDLAGGEVSHLAWVLALATLGTPCAMVALTGWLLGRRPRPDMSSG